MYSETDLETAVASGALTPPAAQAFRDHVAAGRQTPAVDEESFRLLTGFNDIFVAIAAIILLVAVAWIANAIPPVPAAGADQNEWFVSIGLKAALSGLAVAGVSWGLAEFFTRKRRMALPSIILLLAFVGGIFAAAGALLGLAVGSDALENNERLLSGLGAGAATVGAVSAWLHWRRFRVPITVAAGAAAVVGIALGLIGLAVGDVPNLKNILLGFSLALGVAVFLFAMWWDSSDPRRETRRSDVAFWLHLLAAPLIVHPIFSLLGLTDGDATIVEAVIVLGVYVLLGLTALAIDRRALLVSALAYVLFALSSLFRTFGAVELNIALTALVIGSALLLLSAFWHNARRAVVAPLPAGLKAKLPLADRAVFVA